MAQDIKKLLESDVNNGLESFHKKYFRHIQQNMHICAIKCCQRDDLSRNEFDKCITECSVPLKTVHNYVASEIQQFQNKLQRCASRCEEDATEDITNSTSESELAKRQKNYDGCVLGCLQQMSSQVPKLMEKIAAAIEKNTKKTE